MKQIFITRETVLSARLTLPPAHIAPCDVMDVEVLSVAGEPATIEFERILIYHDNGETEWSWEAMTCWSSAPGET
jgi:hypothetical protein